MDRHGPRITLVDGGFGTIFGLSFRKYMIKNGQDIIDNGFNVSKVRENGVVTINAKCFHTTGITESPYHIEFELDETPRRVVNSRCSCQAGCIALCKHGAAVYMWVNQERSESQTDQAQKWHIPSKLLQEKYPKGETIEHLLGFSNPSKSRINVQGENCANKFRILAMELKAFDLTYTSMYKSLTIEPKRNDSLDEAMELDGRVVFLFENPLELSGFPERDLNVLDPIHLEFYNKHVHCNHNRIIEICMKTIGQASKKAWYQERKFRISSSKVKQLMGARKPETLLRYFIQSLADNTNFRYGRENESPARSKYEEITGDKVDQVGLMVHPKYPWLCASPDGIIFGSGEPRLLEIKCPISCKDQLISVKYVKDGNLSKTHMYYFQIQTQMFVSNVKTCDLFIYSSADWILLSVQRDDEFLTKEYLMKRRVFK